MISIGKLLAGFGVKINPKSKIRDDDVHLALENNFYYAGNVEYKQWLATRIAEIKAESSSEKLKFLLEHRNGYLREAALIRVENFRATECWSQVLNLANDWVPVIRTEAKRIAENWLHDATFQQFFPHALALDSLRFKQREDHTPFIEKYELWLTQAQHIELLINVVEHETNQKLVRYSFFLLKRTTLPEDRLIKLGLSSTDVVTNGKMLQRIRGFSTEFQAQYITLLLDSPRDLFRWYGLDFLKQADPEQAKLRSLDFLLSTYSALRDKAHVLSGLTKAQICEIAWHRIQLPSAKSDDVCVGLYLLSQNPNEAYLPAVQACLEHKSQRVQAAALLALCKLAPKIAKEKITDVIFSEKPVLGRAALVAASILQIQVADEQWLWLIRQSASDLSANRILDWSRTFGHWVELAVLLELAKARPEFQNLCKPRLSDWFTRFNNSWSVLSEEHKGWIVQNLDITPSLGVSIQRIEFYLG